MFTRLSERRQYGMAANPLSYQELQAFCRLERTELSPWEVQAVFELDNTVLTVWAKDRAGDGGVSMDDTDGVRGVFDRVRAKKEAQKKGSGNG